MAREGTVHVAGDVLQPYGMDEAEMDLVGLTLKNSIYLASHGALTNGTVSNNTIVIAFTEDMYGASAAKTLTYVDNTNTNKSVYDWKNCNLNYLAPPCSNVFDDCDDGSLDGVKWDTSTTGGSITESSGYGAIVANITGAGSVGRVTSKTNWGTGGSSITYFRIPVYFFVGDVAATFKLQLSSVTGAGGSQVDLVTVTGTGGGNTASYVCDVWISGTTAYVYTNGTYYGSVSIAGIAATWYVRCLGTCIASYSSPTNFRIYDLSSGLGSTSDIIFAVSNTTGTKNIRTVSLVSSIYAPFASAVVSAAPSFSDDNGAAYVTKTYGDSANLATSDTSTYPFLYTFDATDYRGKCKIVCTNDNTGTNFGYPLLRNIGYIMRQ